MSTETKQRWEVGFGKHDFVVASDDGTICAGTDEMRDWKNYARLIAAAPDFLEACKQALPSLEHGAYRHAAATVRAAIEKATGGA